MLATRLPAMKAAGIDLGTLVGTKGADADRGLPARAQWKAQNYNHLFEQPTLFYAVTIILAITGGGGGIDVALAWAYVGFRIAHSIVQSIWNRVAVRFLFFILSSVALMMLAVRAAIAVF